MNKNNDCAILTLRTGQLAPKTADGLRNVNFSLTIGRGKEDERGDLKCNESERKKDSCESSTENTYSGGPLTIR